MCPHFVRVLNKGHSRVVTRLSLLCAYKEVKGHDQTREELVKAVHAHPLLELDETQNRVRLLKEPKKRHAKEEEEEDGDKMDTVVVPSPAQQQAVAAVEANADEIVLVLKKDTD